MYCMAVYNHYIQRDMELGGFYDQILECLDESVRRSLHQRRIRGTCHIYAERSHARHGSSDVVAERTGMSKWGSMAHTCGTKRG